MKKYPISLLLCSSALMITLGSSPAWAQPNPPQVSDKAASSVTMGDKSWVQNMYLGGLEEVRMGKLAVKKATSRELRLLAQNMVARHTLVNQELKKLADKKGLALTPPGALTDEYKTLSNLSGKKFDQKYLAVVVEDHKRIVAAFEKEAGKGGDPNLTSWAAKQLPTLKKHLSMCQNLQKKMGSQ